MKVGRGVLTAPRLHERCRTSTTQPTPTISNLSRRGEDTAPYLPGSFFLLFSKWPFCHFRRVDRPKRKRLPHEVPQWVAEGSFFFITIHCQGQHYNHLCRVGVGDIVFAAAINYHERFLWHCRLMLLMPDHLHAIIAFPREPGMRKTMRDWKKYLARNHQISWQRDFFDHRLRDNHAEMEKTRYILMNPVRKGLCERMEEWQWVCRPPTRIPPRLGY